MKDTKLSGSVLDSHFCFRCHKLRLRLTKEQEDALNATGGDFLTSTSNLSKEQQALINHLEKAEDRLESSIIFPLNNAACMFPLVHSFLFEN